MSKSKSYNIRLDFLLNPVFVFIVLLGAAFFVGYNLFGHWLTEVDDFMAPIAVFLVFFMGGWISFSCLFVDEVRPFGMYIGFVLGFIISAHMYEWHTTWNNTFAYPDGTSCYQESSGRDTMAILPQECMSVLNVKGTLSYSFTNSKAGVVEESEVLEASDKTQVSVFYDVDADFAQKNAFMVDNYKKFLHGILLNVTKAHLEELDRKTIQEQACAVLKEKGLSFSYCPLKITKIEMSKTSQSVIVQ